MMRLNHQHVTSNVCGFFIIKICARAGVNPQSHNFRHFITRRSSFVCCFNLWMQENQYSTLCCAHHQPAVWWKGKFMRKFPQTRIPEIMKNLNRTKHEKRFVENFYGCLSGWKFWWIFFASADSHETPPRGLGITSLREYQCRKIGLRSPTILLFSDTSQIFCHAIFVSDLKTLKLEAVFSKAVKAA